MDQFAHGERMHYQEHIANLRKNLEKKTGISSGPWQAWSYQVKIVRWENPASSDSRPEYLALHRTQSAVVVAPLIPGKNGVETCRLAF